MLHHPHIMEALLYLTTCS